VLGAILVRFGLRVIGGLFIAGFSFLWWYYVNAGPFIDFEGFLINLRSPFGVVTSAGLVLGIAASLFNIVVAVLRLSIEPYLGSPMCHRLVFPTPKTGQITREKMEMGFWSATVLYHHSRELFKSLLTFIIRTLISTSKSTAKP